MNLVFGKGEETEEFWKVVLIPLASRKFIYLEKGFWEVEIHMNALYYAIFYHLGLYPIE